ncbi:MAG: hypothetical protein K8R40_13890 [Anaerolineaceae bacterium]|nr:hypothetical protein [Anaerolineaceae bacterium]
MKKYSVYITLLLISLLMATTACSTEPSETELIVNNEEPVVELDNENNDEPETADIVQKDNTSSDGESEHIQSTNLIIGIFQLEETENPITVDQSTNLLPLWKVYKSLLESSTTAALEQEALIKQISEVMTEDQLAFIAEMAASSTQSAQIAELMEQLGIEQQFGQMGQGANGMSEDLTSEEMEERQAIREAGGGGGGGGGFGSAQDMDPEQLATLQAERAENSGGLRKNVTDQLLIPELLVFLESKLQ